MTYCVSTIESFDSFDCGCPHRQRLPRSVFFAAATALGLVAGAWLLPLVHRDAALGINVASTTQRMAANESKSRATPALAPKIANRIGATLKTKPAHPAKADTALLDPALLRLRPASLADSAPLDTKFPAMQSAPAIQVAQAEQAASPPTVAELRRSDGMTTPTPADKVTATPAAVVPEQAAPKIIQPKIIEAMPVARPADLLAVPAPPRQVAQAETVPLPPPADLRRGDSASAPAEHVAPAAVTPKTVEPKAAESKTTEPMPVARPADLPAVPALPRQVAQAETIPLPPPAMADLRRNESAPAPPERVAPAPVAVAPKAVEPKTVEPPPQSRPADLPAPAARVPERTSPRQVAHNRTIVPASPPADNGSFFDRLFGGRQSSNAALAYASPEDGTFNNNRRLTGNPAAGYDRLTAIYDISAHTVYLPNGTRLEAHSGLGALKDDPRYVNERMRGATPPQVYDLTPREQLFHGVQALRLNPVGGAGVYGRVGLLAHTYMLGPRGDSNGCVSFRDYQAFLRAYQNGEIRRLAVVAHL